MFHNNDYTIELLNRTIDASGLEASISPFVECTLVIGIPLLAVCVFCKIMDRFDPAYDNTSLFAVLSTPMQITIVILGIAVPTTSIYAFCLAHSPYDDVAGHKFLIMPQDSSDNPKDKTLTTVLHDDIVKEVGKREGGFDKFGLNERCEFLNEITDNHPESVLCGGTQLQEVETDSAVFTPYIKGDAFASNPHNVNVTVNVHIDVK